MMDRMEEEQENARKLGVMRVEDFEQVATQSQLLTRLSPHSAAYGRSLVVILWLRHP